MREDGEEKLVIVEKFLKDSSTRRRRRREPGELENRETRHRRLVEKFSKNFTVHPKFFKKT